MSAQNAQAWQHCAKRVAPHPFGDFSEDRRQRRDRLIPERAAGFGDGQKLAPSVAGIVRDADQAEA